MTDKKKDVREEIEQDKEAGLDKTAGDQKVVGGESKGETVITEEWGPDAGKKPNDPADHGPTASQTPTV